MPATLERSPQELLQERLADPRTIESLNRLLDRLDVIVFTAEALEGFLKRAEVVADSVAEGVADLRRMAGDDGSDLIAGLPKMAKAGLRMAEIMDRPEVARLADSGVLEELAKPQNIAAIRTLISKLELAAFSLEAMDGFLARGDEMAETMAAGANELKQLAPAVDGERLRHVMEALPDLVDAGALLAKAGMFEPKTVEVLAQLGRHVAASHGDVLQQPKEPLGFFALLRALKDPEVAASVRLALAVAKRYGRGLT